MKLQPNCRYCRRMLVQLVGGESCFDCLLSHSLRLMTLGMANLAKALEKIEWPMFTVKRLG